MNSKTNYKTRQHDEILDYLKSVKGAHVTALEVYEHLVSSSAQTGGAGEGAAEQQPKRKIGMTTVYRQLDRLVEEGVVDKYIIDQSSPACFEYIGGGECGEGLCVHGKCLKCGKIIHLHCDEIVEMQKHLIEHHGFTPDFHHTVIYGLCSECGGEQK